MRKGRWQVDSQSTEIFTEINQKDSSKSRKKLIDSHRLFQASHAVRMPAPWVLKAPEIAG